MAEDWFSEDFRSLVCNKFVIIIGDSVMRGLYKDLVHFLQYDSYISRGDLRKKGEQSTNGDELIEGGTRGVMTNGTHYREIRQFQTSSVLIRFYFITQVYNQYFDTIVEDLLHDSSPKPDVILMNSCLWDMSRYGPRWLIIYRENLDKMLNAIKLVAKDSLFIWLTCMPVGKRARGGFLPRGVDWKKGTLRLDVLEANFFARQAVIFHGFDVLDLNYYFREFTHLRADDDIHWLPMAHRRMTCIILNHISLAWRVPRPRRVKPLPLMNFSGINERSRHRRHATTPAVFECVQNPRMLPDMNNNVEFQNWGNKVQPQAFGYNDDFRFVRRDYQDCRGNNRSKTINNNRNQFVMRGPRYHRNTPY